LAPFEFVNLLIFPTNVPFVPTSVGNQTPNRNLPGSNKQTGAVAFNSELGRADPGDFTVGSNCGASLAANTTSVLSIAFKPTGTGTRSATLTVSDTPDRTSPYQITLSGVGK
jgi:hypothetical protein